MVTGGENNGLKSGELAGNSRSGNLPHSGVASSSASREHDVDYEEMVKEQQQDLGDMASWSAGRKDEHQKHQLEYMADLDGRLTQARAALANFSTAGAVSAVSTVPEEEEKISDSEISADSGSGSQAPEARISEYVEDPALAQYVASSGVSGVEVSGGRAVRRSQNGLRYRDTRHSVE